MNTAAPNTPYVHFVPTWESITFPFKYYCYSPISFFDYAGKDRNLADTGQYFDLQSLLRTCQLSLAAVPVLTFQLMPKKAEMAKDEGIDLSYYQIKPPVYSSYPSGVLSTPGVLKVSLQCTHGIPPVY